jgi:hypothetical protein
LKAFFFFFLKEDEHFMLSVVVSLLSVIVAVMICLEFDEHIRMVGMTVLDVFFIRHLMW